MGDGVRFVGAGDEVVVVGHQAVGKYVDVVVGCGAGEEFEEEGVVALGVEGALAVVAALGDVEVVAGGSEAGFAGHGVLYEKGGCRG